MDVFLKLSLPLIVALTLCPSTSEGGTPCPSRTELYPCLCTSVPQSSKHVYTIVTCRHIPNSKSLSALFGILRSMQIDKFILYDSFWEAKNSADNQSKLPQNWLSLLNIREMEIIDSELSPGFACDVTMGCPNTVPTHLKVCNSSSTATVDTLCVNSGTKFSWTACLGRLRQFHFVKNKLTTISSKFFAFPMLELTVVNFTGNEITVIEKSAFANLPRLNSLDLSHNKLSNLTVDIFAKKTVITSIDLSWNFIKKIAPVIFENMPHLITLNVQQNRLTKLPEDDWKHLSKFIRTIDVSDNPIHCDCHLIWVNCTTKPHVNVLGLCFNSGFEKTTLRRVSKYMSERCVNGTVLPRDKDNKRNACVELLKKRKSEQSDYVLDELLKVAPDRRGRDPNKPVRNRD